METQNASKAGLILKNAVLSFLSAYAVSQYFKGEGEYRDSVVVAVFFALTLFFAFRRSKRDPSIVKCARIGSLVFALALVVGASVSKTNSIRPIVGSWNGAAHAILSIIGFSWLFFLLLEQGFWWLKNRKSPMQQGADWMFFSGNHASLFFVWAIIFICWIPCWLSYFPGIYSYDIHNQLYEVPVTNFSPILHTLFAKFTLFLGGSSFGGIIVYSLLSMLIMSLVFSFSIRYMVQLKVGRGIRIVTLLYFALNPVIAIFSLVQAKDVFFGGVFLLMTMLFYDLSRNPAVFFASRKKQLALGVVSVLFCLLRNNAILSLALLAIASLFMFRKYWKNIGITLLGPLLVSGIFLGPGIAALGVQQTDPREALSLPLQQIALVARDHWSELKDGDRESIDRILPNADFFQYNPRIADPIKFQFYADNPEKLPLLVKTWPKLLVKYPVDYLDAFLSLNLGIWYPDTQMPNEYLPLSYIETGILGWSGVERDSQIPWLYRGYEWFITAVGRQTMPVVSQLFSIGMPIWLVFIGILSCFAIKKRRKAVFFLPAITLWLPYLASPIANFRFMSPLFMIAPVILAFLSTLSLQDRPSKGPRIEWLEVVNPFPHAHETDRNA